MMKRKKQRTAKREGEPASKSLSPERRDNSLRNDVDAIQQKADERLKLKQKSGQLTFEMIDLFHGAIVRALNGRRTIEDVLEAVAQEIGMEMPEMRTSAEPFNIVIKELFKISSQYAHKVAMCVRFALHIKVPAGECAAFVKKMGGINRCTERYRDVLASTKKGSGAAPRAPSPAKRKAKGQKPGVGSTRKLPFLLLRYHDEQTMVTTKALRNGAVENDTLNYAIAKLVFNPDGTVQLRDARELTIREKNDMSEQSKKVRARRLREAGERRQRRLGKKTRRRAA